MSCQAIDDEARRQRLDEVIGSFLVALDAGQNPDPREWLSRHPDLCPELADFFADRALVDDVVEPMRAEGRVDGESLAATLDQGVLSDDAGPADSEGAPTFNGGGSEPIPRGTQVRYFGDYEIERVLGEGGMGVVYKARQLSLNRPVALKMIKAARFASADDLRRFHNEAESVARLDHSNMVQIFEVGQFQDQHYFSMKLIEGEGLDKRLKDFTGDPRRTARLMVLAAGAIHHAHQRGILHRDLKPANILIDAEGQPHVTDFGLAKRVEGDSELTQTGAILGTPAFMAPEQTSAKKGAITTATDIYGPGAILYALLTGRGPFIGTTVLEILDQVRQRAPEPPRSLNPRVPRDLEVICLKCLEKDPRRRYASADAMAEDLKRYLAGEPIAARPVGNAARFWMWCRRNPALAGAASLLIAALVAVAVLSLLSADRHARLAAAEKLRADEQARHANDEAQAAARLKTAFAESNRRLAILNFGRGQAAFDRGEIGPGLLWMVETLRNATDAGDPGWRRLALANLAAWRPFHPQIRAVFSPSGDVKAVALSPDGRTALIGGDDNTARLWEIETGQPIGRILEHQGAVESVAFSPDGKTILTGSDDQKARLWEAATGKLVVPPLAHQNTVACVAFSPDGKIVLTGCYDKTARLWEASTGRPVGRPMVHDEGSVYAVAFSPDGKMVLTGTASRTLRLWDATTTEPVGNPLKDQGSVYALAFSPDGGTFLTGNSSGTARLWDVATGQPIGKPMQHEGPVNAVAFSPDGKTILTGSEDRTARLWDAATTQSVGLPMVHQDRISAVAFSPDGKTILTGGENQTAQLWDMDSGRLIGRPIEYEDVARGVAFSPDGEKILTINNDSARLRDAATGKPIGKPLRHPGPIADVAFSRDGKTILTGSRDGTARLWDAATGQPIGQPIVHRGWATSVALSPDGKMILTGSDDKTARLWDTATGQPIGQPIVHRGWVSSVAFSPNGKRFITGSHDKMARLWDASTGRAIGKPLEHRGPVLGVAFSPDGQIILTGSSDNTARTWDAATGQPIGQPMQHREPVRRVAFSPDGRMALTGSADAHLWDVATGMVIGKPIYGSVAFGPDGQTILAGNGNWLWDVPSELPDDVPLLTAWVESVTRLTLDGQRSVQKLDQAAWRQQRERLDQLGGPPMSNPRLLDPILYSYDPAARPRALMERQQWTDAQAAFDDAVRARPFRSSVWTALGPFDLIRSRPEKAAADMRRAIQLDPDAYWLRPQQILALLASCDREGLRQACSELLDRFCKRPNISESNNVAWSFARYCVLAQDAVVDWDSLVRLGENARNVSIIAGGVTITISRDEALQILGAAMYRAGRFAVAIDRLENGIQLRGGVEEPADWAFLAMAHHRLGHRDEAGRWLHRFQNYRPSADRGTDFHTFWNEVEVRLLRSEAEAVVRYDPVFPADPFAP